MASRVFMRQCTSDIVNKCYALPRLFSTSSRRSADEESKQIRLNVRKDKVIPAEQITHQKDLIEAPEVPNVGLVSGVPEEHIKTRRVRIYQPAKSAMQSGTNNINFWQIDFDTRERWENPLMGWASSGDPMSNITLDFASVDEAITHCQKMGWDFYVQKPNINQPKPRSYGTNFAWNKRTRVSTK